MPKVKPYQHARRPLCRQIGSNLPEPASQRTAKRHTHWPPPLRTQQVRSYRMPFGLRQLLQPLPYRLHAPLRPIKDQRDFSRPGTFSHLAPYLVHCTAKCTPRQSVICNLSSVICSHAAASHPSNASPDRAFPSHPHRARRRNAHPHAGRNPLRNRRRPAPHHGRPTHLIK